MRAIKLSLFIVTCLCGATPCLAAPVPDKPITVRVASYNVEFGKSASPEQIGEMFKPYKLDIIGFDEAPDGDWTARVGKVLGMVQLLSVPKHYTIERVLISATGVTSELENSGYFHRILGLDAILAGLGKGG